MNSDNRPPLPNPVQRESQSSPGTRPPELDLAATLLAMFALAGLVMLDPAQISAPEAAMTPQMVESARVGMWFLTGIYGAILVSFWRGRNWARVVVLALSALSLINLFSIAAYDAWMSRIFILLDVIVSGYLLFWLTRPEIVAYFRSDKTPR